MERAMHVNIYKTKRDSELFMDYQFYTKKYLGELMIKKTSKIVVLYSTTGLMHTNIYLCDYADMSCLRTEA